MGVIDFLRDKYNKSKNFVTTSFVKKYPTPVSYAKDIVNNPQNRVGQAFDRANNFIQSNRNITAPEIGYRKPFRDAKLENTVRGAYNYVARPIINSASRLSLGTGMDVGRIVTGQKLDYNNLKSPLTKMSALTFRNRDKNRGIQNAPRGVSPILKAGGETAEDVLNVYMPSPAKDLALNAGKQGFKALVKQGAKTGFKAGVVYGTSTGLQKGDNVKEQLINAGKEAVVGGVGGAVVGGTLAAGGYGAKVAGKMLRVGAKKEIADLTAQGLINKPINNFTEEVVNGVKVRKPRQGTSYEEIPVSQLRSRIRGEKVVKSDYQAPDETVGVFFDERGKPEVIDTQSQAVKDYVNSWGTKPGFARLPQKGNDLSNEAKPFVKFNKIDTKNVTESPFISPNSGYVGDFANKKSASGLSYFSQEKVNELNFHLRQAGHKGVEAKDFKGIYSLDKVLPNDALYAKYPALKEHNVVFADFHTPNKRGMMVGNTIYINSNLYEKNPELLNSTIVHEIEHAKQEIKGIKNPDDEIIRGAKEQYQYKYGTDNEIAARKKQEMYMSQANQPLSTTPKEMAPQEAQKSFIEDFNKTYNSGPSKVSTETALSSTNKERELQNTISSERQRLLQEAGLEEPKSYSSQDIAEYNAKVVEINSKLSKKYGSSTTPKTRQGKVEPIVRPVSENTQSIINKASKSNDPFSKVFMERYNGYIEQMKRGDFTPPISGEYAGKHTIDGDLASKWALRDTLVDSRIKEPPLKTPTTPTDRVSGVKPPVEPPMGGTPEVPQGDPVEKIITALKQTKPLRKQQNILNSELRKQQYAKLMTTRSKTSGEAGYFSELGALKGGAKKVDFESVRPALTQTDIDSLFNKINDSNIGDWEKINAKAGLTKLLSKEGASMPTGGELKLMNDVFGKEMTQAILSNRTTWQKFLSNAGEVLNLPRALMASFDLSAPLRQGVVMTSRPKQFFPAFVSMFKQAGSDKAFRAVQEEIAARPTYKLMRESKLALTDIGGDLANREETFMSNLGEKIPLLKYGIKASNRAYTGFLNKMRADVFDDMVSKAKILGNDNPDIATDIAKFVNSATGRGDLGALNRAAPALNSIFFSPRLMAARVNMLNPAYYAKLDPMVRKEAVKSMLTLGAVAGTALGLAKAGGAEVETDMKSADFGKIKVGDTRYDILGGFQQYIVLASRLATGKMTSSTTGKEISLTEGYKPTTRQDIIINFLKSKENPILSYMTGFLDQTNQIGQQFNPASEAINRFIPMFAQDIVDLTEDKGFAKAIGMELPSAFGVGVQTYGRQMPVMGTTPAGNSTIKWRNPYDIGERIVNKVTGKQGSPFSKEEQIVLDQTRRSEMKLKADSEKVIANTQKKINKGETIKGVTTLPDGRGMYVNDKGIQYADTPEKARQKMNIDLFDKSGKKSDLVDGTYLYRDKNGDAKAMPEDDFNMKVATAKIEQAYDAKNYKEYVKLANEKLAMIKSQFENADPLTRIELQNDYNDLQAKLEKYASYGGKFTKGKKAKKISLNFAMPTRVSRASINLRKPTAPRISLKTIGGSNGGTAPTGQPRSIRVKRMA